MYPDLQRLEDITSIRDAPRQIGQEAEAVVELLDVLDMREFRLNRMKT